MTKLLKNKKRKPDVKKDSGPDLADDDIYEAMNEIGGYVDITPADFREIYSRAYRHALHKHEHTKKGSPPAVGFGEILWSWIGAFCGISAVALLHYRFFAVRDMVMLIGSFGASAVLVYGAIKSPLAQPRNLVGGHIISAIVGVLTLLLIPGPLWLSSAVAVATAIGLMHATRTLHPPGGATALIAVTGGEQIKALGFMYVLFPAAAGAIILLIVALVVNNLPGKRRYPEYWF